MDTADETEADNRQVNIQNSSQGTKPGERRAGDLDVTQASLMGETCRMTRNHRGRTSWGEDGRCPGPGLSIL